MLQAFDPVTQQLIQSLINLVNRSNGVIDGARLVISSKFASGYVHGSQASRHMSHQALAPLQAAGLIECMWHLEVLEDFETLKSIAVPRGKDFLAYLNIATQVDRVLNAASTLQKFKCDVDWIDQKLNEMTERWHMGARYLQLGPEHIAEVVVAVKVAQRLATEFLRGRNIRALSFDWFGTAYTIDEHRQIITLFCESQIHSIAKELEFNDQLASLGLLHGSALMHIRGPFEAICDDDKLLDISGWSGVALCGEFIRGFERNGTPSYILTIEDFTLYQRYLANVQDDALILYLGDFPCQRLLMFYKMLVDMSPADTPIYHWGNIDFAGFKVLVALQGCIAGREVKPFQMGAEQLRKHTDPGVAMSSTKLRKLAFASKGELRDLLIDIATLPEELIKACSSEAMKIVTPQP